MAGTTNLETQVEKKALNPGFCRDGGQRSHLRPTSHPVDHGEKVRISLTMEGRGRCVRERIFPANTQSYLNRVSADFLKTVERFKVVLGNRFKSKKKNF